jgi:hypothetical protein
MKKNALSSLRKEPYTTVLPTAQKSTSNMIFFKKAK